jgi:hypothetical protein
MLSALVDSFTAQPSVLLGAYPSLPLLGGVRKAMLTALAAAVKVGTAGDGERWALVCAEYIWPMFACACL